MESQRWALPYIGADRSHYLLMEVKKEAQCTCQAEMVVGSSFIPSVALLMFPMQWHCTHHSELS